MIASCLRPLLFPTHASPSLTVLHGRGEESGVKCMTGPDEMEHAIATGWGVRLNRAARAVAKR
jgi:hypothetical protein